MAICGPSLKICRDAAPAGLCPGVSLGLAAVKVGNDLSGSTLIHPSLHKLFQVLVGLQGDLVWNAIALDHQIGTLLRTQRPTDPVEARPMTPSHCPSVAGTAPDTMERPASPAPRSASRGEVGPLIAEGSLSAGTLYHGLIHRLHILDMDSFWEMR